MSNFWTREAVWARYVEAFDTLRRLPGGRRSTTAWPAIIRDFADALCAEEQRAAELYPFPKGWDKPGPPTHQAIDRMEKLWGWHSQYLRHDEQTARVVVSFAWHQALGLAIVRLSKQLRMNRRAVYRTKDNGMEIVRLGLIADKVAI